MFSGTLSRTLFLHLALIAPAIAYAAPREVPKLLRWYDQFEIHGSVFHWTGIENGKEVYYFDYNGDGEPDQKDVPTEAGHISYYRDENGIFSERAQIFLGAGYMVTRHEVLRDSRWAPRTTVSLQAESAGLARLKTTYYPADGGTPEAVEKIIPSTQESLDDDAYYKGACYRVYRMDEKAQKDVKTSWNAVKDEVTTKLRDRFEFTNCNPAFGSVMESAILDGMSCLKELGGKAAQKAAAMLSGLRHIDQSGAKIGVGCFKELSPLGLSMLPCDEGWPTENKKKGIPAINLQFGYDDDKGNYKPRKWHSGTAFHEFLHLIGYPHTDNSQDSVDTVYACQSCCFSEGSASKGSGENSKAPDPAKVELNRKLGCAMCKKYDGTEKIDAKYMNSYFDLLVAQGYNPFDLSEFTKRFTEHPDLWDWSLVKRFKDYYRDGRAIQVPSKGIMLFKRVEFPKDYPCVLLGHMYKNYSPDVVKKKDLNDRDYQDYVLLVNRIKGCLAEK